MENFELETVKMPNSIGKCVTRVLTVEGRISELEDRIKEYPCPSTETEEWKVKIR